MMILVVEPGEWASDPEEKGYRRGVHQTVGVVARELRNMPPGEIHVFLDRLTLQLRRLRNDPHPHPLLLDEALKLAKEE